MNNALYIAATGMQAQQTNVETIANNIVNANTPAYKKGRISFTEMVSTQAAHGAADANAALAGTVQVGGMGVRMDGVQRQFDAGDLKRTDSAYDVAIRGDGFFELAMPDGSKSVTRGGTLKVNSDGLLATQAGLPLKPGIAVPENLQSLTISPLGQVQASITGQSGTLDLGQLELVRFAYPEQLEATGDNAYRVTEAAGEPIQGDGAGTVVQGSLEGSNVKMVDEMVNLMLAQRAYDASVKVIQAADEMLAAANNLRK